MTGPAPATALTRLAARHALRRAFDDPSLNRHLVVGVSGGADSLALAAALAFEAPKQDIAVDAVVVDHRLQEGSAEVAERARETCAGLGLSARVVPVTVEAAGEGTEAAARTARYAALRRVTTELGAPHLAVAHTGDDQAEQVLLGLVRGSGTRSLAGMRAVRGDVLRPFLIGPPLVPGGPVTRADTVAACEAQGLTIWHDPHNDDERFARVRARRLLGALEDGLHAPTLRRSLMRTADSAARDADLLDRLTDDALAQASGSKVPAEWPSRWPVEVLTALDPALRIRALRRLLVLAGAKDSELGSHHLLDVEGLLVRWQGQGPIDVPGSLEVARQGGEVAIRPRRETE